MLVVNSWGIRGSGRFFVIQSNSEEKLWNYLESGSCKWELCGRCWPTAIILLLFSTIVQIFSLSSPTSHENPNPGFDFELLHRKIFTKYRNLARDVAKNLAEWRLFFSCVNMKFHFRAKTCPLPDFARTRGKSAHTHPSLKFDRPNPTTREVNN